MSIEEIKEQLIKKYTKDGYLLYDYIIDICTDNELDFNIIEKLYDDLLSRGIVIREDKNDDGYSEEENIDRSRTDYENLYIKILNEYPYMENIITILENTEAPRLGEWKKLLKQLKEENIDTTNRIFAMYLRNVLKISYYFSNKYRLDFEECFQEGALGLLHAIKKFNLYEGDSFITYFPWWVRNAITRNVEIKNTFLYIPFHIKERLLKAVSLIVKNMELMQYTYEEAFEDVKKLEDKDVLDDIRQNKILNCLEPLYSWEDLVEEESLEYKFSDNGEFEQRLIISIFNSQLRWYLYELRPREKFIITERYGLEDGREKTLEEVGQMLGITRERVRQVEKIALNKLRDIISEDYLL